MYAITAMYFEVYIKREMYGLSVNTYIIYHYLFQSRQFYAEYLLRAAQGIFSMSIAPLPIRNSTPHAPQYHCGISGGHTVGERVCEK